MKFLSVPRAGPPFFASSLHHDPFYTNFLQVSIPIIYGIMHELYTSWLGSYSCHGSKCQMYSYLAVCCQKKTKKLYGPFYGWGSTASRVKPPWGGSLIFTTKFPEIPGTHFIDLGRMKGLVNLGAAHWFWTRGLWIGNPASWPLGHYSLAN